LAFSDFVFTEVLQEFERDITRNVWTFLEETGLRSSRRLKAEVSRAGYRPHRDSNPKVFAKRVVAGAGVRNEVTD
jgi:hypothetical protein